MTKRDLDTGLEELRRDLIRAVDRRLTVQTWITTATLIVCLAGAFGMGQAI